MVTVRASSASAASQKIQDDAIMGTNNSSIVSKRSVERLYFSEETPYFRHFVKKPQRRSPLINRGYWLRMQAIDHVVRQFSEQTSAFRKIVVNLGCGYDPLPWQSLTRYPESCKDVLFIDVDYKDLMLRKRDAVDRTTELKQPLTNLELLNEGDILLRSDQYLQIGCDLRDLERLEEAISSIVNLSASKVLFVAEVSITYMEPKYADNLIKWVSALPQARFCLLEQLAPEGLDHPFTKTMMAHFEKLKTPIRGVAKYPTTCAQIRRFQSLGWQDVSARNLWALYSSPDFLSPIERKSLDSIEPFDEWEEFALFGCHYVLLVADNVTDPDAVNNSPSTGGLAELPTQSLSVHFSYSESPKGAGCTRFAAALPLKGSHTVGLFAGMGLKTRKDSYDVYSMVAEEQSNGPQSKLWGAQPCPTSRMCHTITDLGDAGALMVGGRTSPDTALKDSWLYHKWLDTWEQVDDIPQPLYRHQAVSLGQGRVLISTGRLNSREISSDYLLWSRSAGWQVCDIVGDIPPPTYGSTFLANNLGRGIIAGGISEYGIVETKIWRWELDLSIPSPKLTFQRSSVFSPKQSHQLCRFGASVVEHEGKTWILGGIVKEKMLCGHDEICAIDNQGLFYTVSIAPSRYSQAPAPSPLFVGLTVVSAEQGLLIAGGGAVCFSFGTFWNRGCYSLTRTSSDTLSKPFRFIKTTDAHPQARDTQAPTSRTPAHNKATTISRAKISSPADFEKLVEASVPVVLEGLDFGKCREKWSDSYLLEKVGPERQVIVHRSESSNLDFAKKNFKYVNMPFGEFLNSVNHLEKVYMRSVSSERPAEIPSDISKDFPEISVDFRLPEELNFVSKNAHSSPLRISGPTTMWLHYDVMANVLCQVRGQKRLVLFPPQDVMHMDLEPGASSSSINIFDNLEDPRLAPTHPYEAILSPGDILFIPSLWFHTASPIAGSSIAVNVFFRDLKSGYGVGKDVYGNRDLQAYDKGRQDVMKIVKSFEKLPSDARDFYLKRLVAEFQRKSLGL